MKKLILISGTGRSGTHLIGRTISTHPDIKGRIESPDTFNLITKIATTQDNKNPLYITYLKKLLVFKLTRILKKSKYHILEKSHPSIWLAEFIFSKFNNAFLIGVWRDVEPTINSMLQHQGVLSWYKLLQQNKKNRFLGISESNKKYFKNLSIEEKCSLRWLSHKNELYKLKNKYPNKVLLIKYDDFLKNPSIFLEDISHFLDITNNFKLEKFKIDSLDKWKQNLTLKQLENIYKITSQDETK